MRGKAEREEEVGRERCGGGGPALGAFGLRRIEAVD